MKLFEHQPLNWAEEKEKEKECERDRERERESDSETQIVVGWRKKELRATI